jgi:hypothetical protein
LNCTKFLTPTPTSQLYEPVTGATCSEKVTKQNPEVEFHSFTFESSPPVAMYCPSEEKSKVLMPYKWPCCLSTYVSDCTYRIRKYNGMNRLKKSDEAQC